MKSNDKISIKLVPAVSNTHVSFLINLPSSLITLSVILRNETLEIFLTPLKTMLFKSVSWKFLRR